MGTCPLAGEQLCQLNVPVAGLPAETRQRWDFREAAIARQHFYQRLNPLPDEALRNLQRFVDC